MFVVVNVSVKNTGNSTLKILQEDWKLSIGGTNYQLHSTAQLVAGSFVIAKNVGAGTTQEFVLIFEIPLAEENSDKRLKLFSKTLVVNTGSSVTYDTTLLTNDIYTSNGGDVYAYVVLSIKIKNNDSVTLVIFESDFALTIGSKTYTQSWTYTPDELNFSEYEFEGGLAISAGTEKSFYLNFRIYISEQNSPKQLKILSGIKQSIVTVPII